MKIVYGDLWSELGRADLILFTANSMVDSKGHLVMGCGSALEAKRRSPDIPLEIGRYLLDTDQAGKEFLVWLPYAIHQFSGDNLPNQTFIGAFQTKREWRYRSFLDLIERSIIHLNFLLEAIPWIRRVAMPFPGIGHGLLTREEVLPLLQRLPDSVVIYDYPEK